MCDFIPQLKGGREVHVVRPRVSVENELADWKTTKNEKLALRFSHNHTCKNYADIRLQHPAKMSFFCTNESSVMLRRKWKKKIKIKKNKRRLGGKILHHSLSNIFAYRCKSDRGSVGVLRWFSSQRRCPVCRGPTAERVPSPPAPPPPQPLPLLSVDRGHLVQAVLLGFEPQVGDAVGHVHSLGRVGVGAGGRVGGHGAERQEEGRMVTSPEADMTQLWKYERGVTWSAQKISCKSDVKTFTTPPS